MFPFAPVVQLALVLIIFFIHFLISYSSRIIGHALRSVLLEMSVNRDSFLINMEENETSLWLTLSGPEFWILVITRWESHYRVMAEQLKSLEYFEPHFFLSSWLQVHLRSQKLSLWPECSQGDTEPTSLWVSGVHPTPRIL